MPMGLVADAHRGLVFERRAKVLAEALAALLPSETRLLDVGCGDGTIDRIIQLRRPDVKIQGVDVLVRTTAQIPVTRFDGTTLPFDDGSFEYVMLVDVLHHVDDQSGLLKECARVARNGLIIKDHICEGLLNRVILSFMDWVGNAPHGVRLPYNYLSQLQWDKLFRDSGLSPDTIRADLELYPWPARIIFERNMHFVVALRKIAPS
jgi:SAM-dependent methyltransferase